MKFSDILENKVALPETRIQQKEQHSFSRTSKQEEPLTKGGRMTEDTPPGILNNIGRHLQAAR